MIYPSLHFWKYSSKDFGEQYELKTCPVKIIRAFVLATLLGSTIACLYYESELKYLFALFLGAIFVFTLMCFIKHQNPPRPYFYINAIGIHYCDGIKKESIEWGKIKKCQLEITDRFRWIRTEIHIYKKKGEDTSIWTAPFFGSRRKLFDAIKHYSSLSVADATHKEGVEIHFKVDFLVIFKLIIIVAAIICIAVGVIH